MDILSGRENDTHTTVTVLRKKNSLDMEDLNVEAWIEFKLIGCEILA